jgi:hypothetical protein
MCMYGNTNEFFWIIETACYSSQIAMKIFVREIWTFLETKKPQTLKLHLNAGLLARIPCASGRSCDRLLRSMFSLLFLGSIASVELIPKIHMALYASHTKIDFNFFTETQSSLTRSKFRNKSAFQTQNSYKILNLFPLLYIPSSPLTIMLP